MNFVDLLIAVLAVWRVAALLVHENGPFDVLAALRRAAARLGATRLLACFYCTSFWVAAPAALWLDGFCWRLLIDWLAVAGGAGLLERATTRPEPQPSEAARVVGLEEAEAIDARGP
jgi:hypothetical protein